MTNPLKTKNVVIPKYAIQTVYCRRGESAPEYENATSAACANITLYAAKALYPVNAGIFFLITPTTQMIYG